MAASNPKPQAGQVLHMSLALRDELAVYAREAHPEEACGFLIGTEDEAGFKGLVLRLTPNLHPYSETRFLVDPLAYRSAERFCGKHADKGYRILGFWHTHPDAPAEPSAIDLEEAVGLYACFPTRYLYLIVSASKQSDLVFACWRLHESGRTFEKLPLAFF